MTRLLRLPDFLSVSLSLLLLVGLPVLGGCASEGEEEDGPPGSADAPPAARAMTQEVQEMVEEGNQAQRDGRYQEALDFYTRGMDADPDHPIPQFGALMASLALGDSALADSLRQGLEVSAPELVRTLGPGGSMGGMMNPHGAGEAGGDPHAGLGGMMPGMMPPAGDSGAGGLPPGHPMLFERVPDTAADVSGDTASGG